MTNFGSRLRSLREKLSLSGSAFAKQANLHRTYVSDVENGRGEPSRNFLQALHDTFGVSYDWLLSGEGEMFIKRKDETQTVHVSEDVSVSGSNIVTANHGSVMIRNGHEKLPSVEGAELLRIFESLDVKQRHKLLDVAFTLEGETKKEE